MTGDAVEVEVNDKKKVIGSNPPYWLFLVRTSLVAGIIKISTLTTSNLTNIQG